MKKEYETLCEKMLTDNQAYKEWQTKKTLAKAPKDEKLLKFYLDHYAFKFLTSNSNCKTLPNKC